MEKTNSTAKPRRVGTFTLGLTLISSGSLMAISMFFPQLDLRWALKSSPLILIMMGIETLMAARSGEKVRYDWVGMLLCFLLVCTALCLYAIAWWVMYGVEYGLCF